jgi:alpha-tubulin suppressor-like RCC1 family protein
VAHEFGHDFAQLQHANAYQCSWNDLEVALAPDLADCTERYYGDPSSVMGETLHDFTVLERSELGWISSSNMKTVTTSGTYTIAPVEMKAPTGVVGIQIARSDITDILLEFRQPYGIFDNYDADDPYVNGVIVRLEDTSMLETNLLNTNPTSSSENGAPLAVGRSFYDPTSGVKITTLSVSSSGAQVYVDFSPNMGLPSATTPKLSQTAAQQSSPVTVSTTASGPNAIRRVGLTIDGSLEGLLQPTDGPFGATSEAVSATVGVPAGAVSAAGFSACSLLADGSVRCWGLNDVGQLGVGYYAPQTYTEAPVAASGMMDATSVATGESDACVLKADGTVWCWGNTGVSPAAPIPYEVPGISGAKSIAVGKGYACALFGDGTAQCWGDNAFGGLGAVTDPFSPTAVLVQGLSGAVALSAQDDDTCALLSGGTAMCWGYNGDGELGDGTTTNRWGAVNIDGLVGASQVSAGADHTCALVGGRVECWGSNYDGELGDGTTTNSLVPVTVAGINDAVEVSAGSGTTCAVLADHTVSCWGNGLAGQLGNGDTSSSSVPVQVSGIGNALSVSVGAPFACAVLTSGSDVCWGDATFAGELGDGTVTSSSTPVPVLSLGRLAVGTHTLCVRATDEFGIMQTAPGACSALTVANPPGAPTAVAAEAGNASVEVHWVAPVSDGGSPISGFSVTSSPDGKTCTTATALYCTVTDLTNGVPYTFTVKAANILGPGPASIASNGVTPALLPDVPTSVTAVAGNASVVVSWKAPASNVTSAITGYIVGSSPDGRTCSTTGTLTCTVLGLSNGTGYTFTVRALNAVGTGPSSAPSTTVVPRAPSTYHAIGPRRVLDTRSSAISGNPTNIGLSGPFTAGTVRTFQVAGAKYVGGVSSAAVPSDAVAVTGNLTVTHQTASGVIALGPTMMATGSTTTLDFVVGENRANNVTMGLSATGTLSAVFRCSTTGATVDVIFDVTGYFTPDDTGATYHALAPGRVLDTRSGSGHIGLSGKFASKSLRTISVVGVRALGWPRALVPSTAVAVTANVTLTNATSNGYVALGPTMSSSPSTSTLNVMKGRNTANGVTVAIKSGKFQAVWVGTIGSSTDVVLDITGYFTADSTGLKFYAVDPYRVLDSSANTGLSGSFASGASRSLTIAGTGGSGGVPADAKGISGNLTLLNPSSNGFGFIAPMITGSPTSSTVNANTNFNVANGFDVPLDSSELALVWVGAPDSTADVALDINGYWQ